MKTTTMKKEFSVFASTLGLLGNLGGLYLAWKQKKGFWGYAGYFLLGGISGGTVGFAIDKTIRSVKGDKKEPEPSPTVNSGNLNDKIYTTLEKWSKLKNVQIEKPLPSRKVFDAKMNTVAEKDKEIIYEIILAMDKLNTKYSNAPKTDQAMAANFIIELSKANEDIAKKFNLDSARMDQINRIMSSL